MVLMGLAVGRKNNNDQKIRFVACGESGFNQIDFLGKIGLLPTQKKFFFAAQSKPVLLMMINNLC